MKRQRWLWLMFVSAMATGTWLAPRFISLPITVSYGHETVGHPMSHPLSKAVKDDRPPFQLDPDRPWNIEFGRGSGWHGLDTVKLSEDGRLVLHRMTRERQGEMLSWETAAAQLPPDAVVSVLKAVESNRLLELHKAYHADVCDGTQWVLWIRQGDKEKSVYFNNHFPSQIVRFAEKLDEVVSGSVGPVLRWRAVPSARARDHEREIWESIRR